MRKHTFALLLICLLLAGILAGCHSESEKRYETLADFHDARIGVITGSAHDKTAQAFFPDAQRVYFNSMADMVLAVEQGKIDCYIEDAPFLTALIWEGIPLKPVEEAVATMRNGFVFPQGDQSRPLRETVNEFLAQVKADGTVERLIQKWMAPTEPAEHPDYLALEPVNGTIRLAVSVDNKPLLYQKDGLCTGFEMDLLTLFGQQYGYAFEIEVVPFDSILAGIATGKYHMGASTLNITPEREESVDFSDPYATFNVVLVTLDDSAESTELTMDDFQNATLAIHTGSVYEDYAKALFPNAQRKYYNLMSDMLLAVEQEKVDGYLSELPYVTAAIWEGASVRPLEKPLAQSHAGFVFPKEAGSALLREQMNTFIRKARADGLLDSLSEKWFGDTEPLEPLSYDGLTGENGTLRVATAPDLKPISYIKNEKPTGYEIELLVAFAREYGYDLDMSYMTFDAILPSITSGKYDLGGGAVTINEERAQSVDFSESHLTVDVVLAVKAGEPATLSFWEELKTSFEKTFIREDRWKLIVDGIGVTMLISICAALSGTLLGFGLFMLSRSDTKLLRLLARGIASVYSRLIAGTPVVVILMILFYVVFGSFRDMSGILVAIIGFCLTFGAFVYDHMTVSAGSVDPGQTEAAYALGYNKNKTFFRVIFPQAMAVFLPSYCGQMVDLVKATAVVGYIAVNDLTKVGDIIRSNTYEAFFPLIATAVIYFLLTWLLSVLLGLVRRRFEPKRRSAQAILKGVNIQ